MKHKVITVDEHPVFPGTQGPRSVPGNATEMKNATGLQPAAFENTTSIEEEGNAMFASTLPGAAHIWPVITPDIGDLNELFQDKLTFHLTLDQFATHFPKKMHEAMTAGREHWDRYVEWEGNSYFITTIKPDGVELVAQGDLECSVDWCVGHECNEAAHSRELSHRSGRIELCTDHGPWGLDSYGARVERCEDIDGATLYVELEAVGELTHKQTLEMITEMRTSLDQLETFINSLIGGK